MTETLWPVQRLHRPVGSSSSHFTLLWMKDVSTSINTPKLLTYHGSCHGLCIIYDVCTNTSFYFDPRLSTTTKSFGNHFGLGTLDWEVIPGFQNDLKHGRCFWYEYTRNISSRISISTKKKKKKEVDMHFKPPRPRCPETPLREPTVTSTPLRWNLIFIPVKVLRKV